MRARLLALGMLLSVPALAAEPACWIPYSEFEGHVGHIDAEACPDGILKPEDGFCRFAISDDRITIYVFREVRGQPCLVSTERMSLTDFFTRHGIAPNGRPPG